MYLINTGHELVWVHEHQVNQAATNSLGENLVGENIIVWWHDKAQGSKPTSYTGKIVAFRENDADRHEVNYRDGETDYIQLETLNVRHSRGDEETTCRVMWMLQRPDLDVDTLSKQLELDKNKKIHKRKAEVKQVQRRKKRKKQQNDLSDDEESDSDADEQPIKKIATADTAAQAQPQSRYPTRRIRKQNVPINMDHPQYRTGWGASDTQKKKASAR